MKVDLLIMEKLTDNAIEELVRQKLAGESYSRIRSNLAGEGFNESDIKSIIRQVDEGVLRAEIEQSNRNRIKPWHRTGLVLAVMGLVLTIIKNAGWMLAGTSRWLVYSPFFAGILLMLYGRLAQQKISDPSEKGPGQIRKKRPYK